MTAAKKMALTVSHLDAEGHSSDIIYNIPLTGKLICTFDLKSPHPEAQTPAVQTRFMIFANKEKDYQLLTVTQEHGNNSMSYQHAPDKPCLQELRVSHGCNHEALMSLNAIHPFNFMAQDVWVNRHITFAINQMMGKPIDLRRSRLPALLAAWNPAKYKS